MDENSTQNTSAPAATAESTISLRPMPNWITTNEGQHIFVSIMALARGANGNYSKTLCHGQRRRFFLMLAKTEFLPGGIFEEYIPISSIILQRRFAEMTQYIRSHFDLQGAHSTDNNDEGTWPQSALAYFDYLKWHDSQNNDDTKKRKKLMVIQRSIMGEQPTLGTQHKTVHPGPHLEHKRSTNELGAGTEVEVIDCSNTSDEVSSYNERPGNSTNLTLTLQQGSEK